MIIKARYCGPPDSANGGYICGRLAAGFSEPVRVRLHAPPPLDTELTSVVHNHGLDLKHGERLIASAGPAEPLGPAPASPGAEQATQAGQRYTGFVQHPYPGCFVCGTGRDDGLRIFAGPLAESPGPLGSRVAAPWTPGSELDDGRGRVAGEFLYAALDCPGAFTFQPAPGMSMLLGQLSGELLGSVAVAEPCVILAWPLAHQGRKHTVGSAIYGADGGCRAQARAIWIEVPISTP